MKALFILLSCSIICAIGCSGHADPKALVGKYCFNRIANRDSLFVNADKTYEHKFVVTDGRIYEASGKWENDSTSNEILFKDFVFFNEAGSDGLPPGNWYSKVQTTENGEVRLMYSTEDNIYFSKK